MHILDCSELAKQVLDILLGRFLVHVCDDDDPAFDGADRGCAGLGARVAGLGLAGGALGLVDVHLCVGHGE